NDTATTEIYTLSLHDALPISYRRGLNLTTRHDIAGQSRQTAALRPVPPPAKANGSAARPARAPAKFMPIDDCFFDYKFKNPSLLTLALTHSSLAYESNTEGTPNPGSDNEQLEFIGDAVLGL